MQGNLPFIVGGVLTGWLIVAGLMWKERRWGLAAAALMGLLVSLYLGYQHLDSAGTSVCSVSETFDCDRLNRSEYSEIAGVPIALLGSGYYGAVLTVAILSLLKPASYRRLGSLLLVGGGLSVLYSLFLAGVSVKLGAWCLFCISMYGVNALILVAGWAMRDPEGLGALFSDKEDRSVSAMLTGGMVVFLGSMAWYNSQKPVDAVEASARSTQGGDSSGYAQLMELPEGSLALDGTEPVLGDPGAPYIVVEFADFECPACAAVTPQMHELVGRNPNIQVMFKHYPLSGLCNPGIEGERHKNACPAAFAAECARQQGKFWDLAHLMFENQTELDAEGIAFMAGQVGLDPAALAACQADPATRRAVLEDIEAAIQVGVHGTPSLFFKGTHGDQWVAATAGPEGIELLVKAHAAGKALPPVPAAGATGR